MSSNKWNQSDTATLIRDQAAGGRPIETARKLGQRVGFVFLKAASLRRPFQGEGQSNQAHPSRHAASQPIMRGPNGAVQAVFNAIGQTVMVTSPMQVALERMLSDYAKHDETASVLATITPARPVDEAQKKQNEAPSVKVAVEDAEVRDMVEEPPAPASVTPVSAPATPKESRTVAYLVAGDDEAIETFRQSVERGIEPSRPAKRTHAVSVTAPVSPPAKHSTHVYEPVKKSGPLQQSALERKEASPKPEVKKQEVKSGAPAKVVKPSAPVPVASPPAAKTPPAPAAPAPVRPKVQAPAPVSQQNPAQIRVPEAPRVTPSPVSRPAQTVTTPAPARPVDNAVNSVDDDALAGDYIPIDPDTGEILTGSSEERRSRRDSLARVSVAERESERNEDYKPTAAERRYRMNQLREAAKRVPPPSGRIISESEGLRKIMSIIG